MLEKKRGKRIFLGIAFGLFFVVCVYIGYCLGTLGGQPLNIYKIEEQVLTALLRPFPIRITAWTWKTVLIMALIWLIALEKYLQTLKNYRFGEEAGSARIASPETANQSLCDEDEHRNKIVTEHLRISYDTRKTKLNNNMLVIGGSGAGKSFYVVKPNAYAMQSSYIFCDPKGELLRDTGNYLKQHGYRIAVLNLVDMADSDGYNPFAYLRSDEDINKLITNLIRNTTPKNAGSNDPFWEKAESMLLQSLMLYVCYEYPKKGKRASFRGVLELLNQAKVDAKGKEPSPLDKLMYALPEEHPALVTYKKVASGAADTIRSVIITAHARLAPLQNEQVLRILDADELDIPSIGEGVRGNPQKRTAVYCVIPDSDQTYNFIVGMLYTQLFQELYYVADHKYRDKGGELPIHVALWMDEFANVALPDNFCHILSTMRSRNLSCNIIIQNLAQIKELFRDSWETLTGNCDTLLYLGGNEQSTHKYISELIGKQTIDKCSTGETMGKNGTSSRNFDFVGRELMLPEEVRKFDNIKCLAFVKGYDPILDDKYRTAEKPAFREAKALRAYVSRKETEALLEEGRLRFYIDDPRKSSNEASWLYQIHSYGGIFEEAESFQRLTRSEDEKYLLLPEETCRYKDPESLLILQPVFTAKAEWIAFPNGKLRKHAIVGCSCGDEIKRLNEADIQRIFTAVNHFEPKKS